jgi:hypothetical protein
MASSLIWSFAWCLRSNLLSDSQYLGYLMDKCGDEFCACGEFVRARVIRLSTRWF